MLDKCIALAPYIVLLYSIFIITFVIYRCFFHPLAHIPGPFLARITHLYEWYYDLYLKGQYTWHLKELHQKYGPVVRISPEEVHIHDADYFSSVYNNTNGRMDKPTKVAQAFGPFAAVVATQYHDLHKIRRNAMGRYFSTTSVNELTPTMLRPVRILCDRLGELSKTKQTIDMQYFFAAVTLDIMNGYCFSYEPQNVLKPDFGKREKDDIDLYLEVSLWTYHMPWIMRLIFSLPDAVNKLKSPAMANILNFRGVLFQQIEAIRNGQDESHKSTKHRTIFHDLLSSKLPPKELGTNRLRDEAFTLVLAGSDSTANAIRGLAYHIAANPPIRQRLYEELKTVIPNPSLEVFPSIAELEQLPYFSAVIKEGLRVCSPIPHRLGRTFPEKDLICHGHVIPAGAHVSMTANLTHEDEKIFSDPYVFRPERWLEEGPRLEPYLLPFSAGIRGCLGMNLARAELFLILAAVFRKFTFDVSEVSRARDIDLTRDFIIGAPSADSPGILVKVEKVTA